jgi:RHS repeat-associated protein
MKIDAYPPASMETAQSATEDSLYSNIDNTRYLRSSISGYPTTDSLTNPNDYVAKANGSGNKIGPAMVLKVMAGDKFNLRVSSWYKLNGNTPGTPNSVLTDLINAMTSSVGAVSSKSTSSDLSSNGTLNTPAQSFLNTESGYTTTKPKAFLNWILLDEQFKFVSSSSGFEQVGADQEFKIHQFNNMNVDKNGYLYVYVSNETPNIDVFFDNLQVTHIRGPLLEEAHYYPFGLTMAGISSKAAGAQESKKRFQGQEFAHNEFSDGSGLEMYEFKWRMDDPQTGRFWQIDPLADEYVYNSPYAFSENKVTTHVELEGLEAEWFERQVERDLRNVSSDNLSTTGLQQRVDARNASGSYMGQKVLPFVIAATLQPELSIPFMVGYLSGVPVTPSPQAMSGTIASEAATIEGTSTIRQNAAKGQEFEKTVVSDLAKEGHTNLAEQVTVKAGNGVKTRIDAVSTNPNGQLALTEAKSSYTAPLTTNQKSAFPSIAQSGGVVVGKGKPAYPGGTIIPPTQVNIVRPSVDNTYVVKPVIPIIPLQRKNN